jgi:hypothetical protein
MTDCGHLHSLHVNLVAGKDCVVTEIVGSLYELKTVHYLETHLILAKVRLPGILSPCCVEELNNSEVLIADLEKQLGDNFTSYLTIRLTYQHTAFAHEPCSLNSDNGLSVQTTSLQTEATAYIKRHSPNSTWSCKSRTTPYNPLIPLIESHYSPGKARDAVRRLADDRVHIPTARRNDVHSEGASEETVRPSRNSSIRATKQRAKHQQSTSEMDPARKIWTEMRRTSRGQTPHDRPHHRRSISQGTYSPSANNHSPRHINSSHKVDDQRNRIRQHALRNKRSVGADTLRSIAPSVGRGKGGSVAGSLGLGRNWGWGGSWW